ncbi:MAG TPA: anthranilate phosphoribosyltransferase [Acidobacteriaceae bacterium]|nr:anthranilate phosphoribosyltransferase [Acidobacteriaceae bacterium]
MAITAELKRLTEGRQTLTTPEAQALMQRILVGDVSDLELAATIGAMAARGETAAEIAGFALALRSAANTLPLTETERDEVVDTCGTGGDGSGTFNISTAAALVAAAAGVKVAKHGNRAVTSKCGSADVLEALGIPIDLSPRAAAEALRVHGFCFLLAPAHHPGLRAVMPVRRALGVRTIFNLLGPLLNPAGARRQVMGVYSDEVLRPVAEAMPLLGVRHAMVVHGAGGLDELSVHGPSRVMRVREVSGASEVTAEEVNAEEIGFAASPLSALAGGESAQDNAQILRDIFAGERGPRRDAVVLNAAAVLVVADRATDLRDGAAQAARAIDAGAVSALLMGLRS